MNVNDELENISNALRQPFSDDKYCQLYAAQQALAWALNPGCYASPYKTILKGKVMPIKDTQEDLTNCLAVPHPLPS